MFTIDNREAGSVEPLLHPRNIIAVHTYSFTLILQTGCCCRIWISLWVNECAPELGHITSKNHLLVLCLYPPLPICFCPRPLLQFCVSVAWTSVGYSSTLRLLTGLASRHKSTRVSECHDTKTSHQNLRYSTTKILVTNQPCKSFLREK